MKHVVWITAALAMLASGARAGGPATDKGPPPAEQLQQHERALEVKAREMKLNFEQKMHELELEQRRTDIEQRKAEIERSRRKKDDGRDERAGFCALVLLLVLINHILVTVWVCKDMREQGIGRALWVPIVLLSGVMGGILYAIVRVADTRPKPAAPETKSR